MKSGITNKNMKQEDNKIHASINGVIRAAKKRRFSLEEALLELIDNSVDAKATRVKISDIDSSLIISDNGKGFDNIVRALDYGESDKEEGNIGRFGVGFKDATAKYSKETTVSSNGKQVIAPWAAMSEGESDGTVIVSNIPEDEWTHVFLDGFRPAYNRSIKTEFVRRVYAPMLAEGSLVIRINGKKLKPLKEPDYTQEIDETFAYQGKKCRVRGGIFKSDDPMRKNWMGYNLFYQNRLIGRGKITTSGVGDEFICTNFCFNVDLIDDGKNRWQLATNKNQVEGTHEFLEYVYTQYTRPLLEYASKQAEQVELLDVIDDVNGMLRNDGNQRRTKTTGKTGTIKPTNTGSPKVNTFTDDDDGEYISESPAGGNKRRQQIDFGADNYGTELALFCETGKRLAFIVNKNNEWIKRHVADRDVMHGMARLTYSMYEVIKRIDTDPTGIITSIFEKAGEEMNFKLTK